MHLPLIVIATLIFTGAITEFMGGSPLANAATSSLGFAVGWFLANMMWSR